MQTIGLTCHFNSPRKPAQVCIYIRHKSLSESMDCVYTYVMPMVQNVSSTMRMVSLEPLMEDSPAKAAIVTGFCVWRPGKLKELREETTDQTRMQRQPRNRIRTSSTAGSASQARPRLCRRAPPFLPYAPLSRAETGSDFGHARKNECRTRMVPNLNEKR